MYIIYPDLNGTSVVKPDEVAEVFVKHFQSVYNNSSLESYHSGILSIDVLQLPPISKLDILNLYQKGITAVCCCYYSNKDLCLLTHVI